MVISVFGNSGLWGGRKVLRYGVSLAASFLQGRTRYTFGRGGRFAREGLARKEEVRVCTGRGRLRRSRRRRSRRRGFRDIYSGGTGRFLKIYRDIPNRFRSLIWEMLVLVEG